MHQKHCGFAKEFVLKNTLQKKKKCSSHPAMMCWSWCFYTRKGRNRDSGFIQFSTEGNSRENLMV